MTFLRPDLAEPQNIYIFLRKQMLYRFLDEMDLILVSMAHTELEKKYTMEDIIGRRIIKSFILILEKTNGLFVVLWMF